MTKFKVVKNYLKRYMNKIKKKIHLRIQIKRHKASCGPKLFLFREGLLQL